MVFSISFFFFFCQRLFSPEKSAARELSASNRELEKQKMDQHFDYIPVLKAVVVNSRIML